MPDHKDHRELGYSNVDAQPDIDGASPDAGGESGGGARAEPVETTDGAGTPGGQTDPVYRGGDNDNATRKGGA